MMFRAASSSSSSSPRRFYCSSGGNAGLACITAANALNLPATIVVPTSTAPIMVTKLRDLGAEVHQVGASWAEADAHLRDVVMASDPDGVYVPPFDHPDIWTGAATLIDELVVQMDVPVHGIVCSVGGGGLLNGVMHGIEATPWPAGQKPSVLAVETEGAASLNECVKTGNHATLDAITSIATSLGARKVSEKTYEWLQSEILHCITVKDWEAAMSCVRFADDARFVVEVSCGATIAPAYFAGSDGENRLRKAFEKPSLPWDEHNVVLVVCGGSSVSLDVLDKYRNEYGHLAAAATATTKKTTNGVNGVAAKAAVNGV